MRLFKKSWDRPGMCIYEIFKDALQQPHLLIAGATGSGKSVVINDIIYTALSRYPVDEPDGTQFILIDPKRVELISYKRLPHTIRYASEPKEMLAAIQYAMNLCEKRYKAMQRKSLKKYDGGDIYLIIDEFADLMTTQRKAVQPLIQRLAQIGRAARVHIILATQTPIAKVLPTEIKCNFDARFGLRTRSAQDSRNIIGMPGLESLKPYGTAYYMTPKREQLYNIPYIQDDELNKVINFWLKQ